MLRHQKTEDNDISSAANVITILCTSCGENRSVFIQEFLNDFFPDWEEQPLTTSAPLFFEDELIEGE